MHHSPAPAFDLLAEPGACMVCHCNMLTETQILGAIDKLNDNGLQLITPGLVYRELGKRGRCCGCFRRVVELIHQRVAGVDSDPAVLGGCSCDERSSCTAQGSPAQVVPLGEFTRCSS
ncbi:(2Fe-2S)-binding protein [Oryzibacter oryziterrae]|uniref:(2Fe-2S)-binding protein n=1 Tax=Oryzibacter oryziterrae TaxID=2766474 RepID=UPI001F20D00B|nr:(2Fe-2S)-binding protein [Oryzibacter oryziterrae]